MAAPSLAIPWKARLGWTRSSTMLLSLIFATVIVIGVVWWPLLADYVASYDPRRPWWVPMDWLLLRVFLAVSRLIISRPEWRRDARTSAVGLIGGLVIESWGTQTGLWSYYTLERPPLWMIPAWPIATLAIARMTRFPPPTGGRPG